MLHTEVPGSSAGGAVNRLLAAGLEAKTGESWVAGNLSVRCKEVDLATAREGAQGLLELDWASAAAHGMTRGMVSKFQPCLPTEAEDRFLAERLLDIPATRQLELTALVTSERIAA